MSFIQLESAHKKDKLRQDLRASREQMLEMANCRAVQQAQKRTREMMRGDDQWMLPTVSAKIKKISNLDTGLKKSKSQKKEKKKKKESKMKKTKKQSNKRRYRSSSSSDSSCDSHEYSSEEEDEDRMNHKKKIRNKNKHESLKSISKSSSGSDNCSVNERVLDKRKKRIAKQNSSSISSFDDSDTKVSGITDKNEKNKNETTLQRDSWMTETMMLKTFTRTKVEKTKINQSQHIDSYDPAKSTRELNPYWKTIGTGLPGFQKPKTGSDEDEEQSYRRAMGNKQSMSSSLRGWCKSSNNTVTQRDLSTSPSTSQSINLNAKKSVNKPENVRERRSSTNEFLTDQQMNELAAKILKAEIMGRNDVANELKEKLEKSRAIRNGIKKNHHSATDASKMQKYKSMQRKESEEILLTLTDRKGNCRPLTQSTDYVRTDDHQDLYGGRRGGCNRSRQYKRTETHINAERVRYFPDDDKYNIKQMFEREKYASASDNNLQFANIVSKSKNSNDDLDDIFTDNIRYNQSKDSENRKELQNATNEQRSLMKQLDNCDKCFDADKMDKKLLIAMGDKSYLALPSYVGLQPGHCVIAPLQHITCSTQLDEDTWEEITNFRKALTRMFSAQHKDVIFFEIANKLQHYPHLTIHCIPIPERDGDTAVFYFKKAIEESEHEWSVNKQLISLRNKSLRSAIPKGLDYFWVHFSMDTGFAHVIEDQSRFPSNFAMEIIGGMLQLDANRWRRPKKEQNLITKVKLFADSWKKYDFTIEE